MFILSQEKLSKFLDEISRGFIRSPLEIAIFIVLVIGFLLFLFFMYRYQTAKRKLLRQKIEQELFQKEIIKKSLNQVEIEILERMAGYLRQNQGKHLLFENPHIFNSCLDNIKKKEKINEQIVAGLRIKLGFRKAGLEKVIHSSVDLPEDLSLLILQKGKKQCTGNVEKVEQDSLVVTPKSLQNLPAPGTPVRVYFKSYSGVFSFNTWVKKSSKSFITLAHSESINRLQRRRFYRKRLKQPVFIRLAGSDQPPEKSTLLDLGGGGASLENVKKSIGQGDEVEISFNISGKHRVTLNAKVLRLSDDGKIVHLEFLDIPESIRDMIISHIFSRKHV